MTEAPERIWIEDEFGEGDDDQWTYGTWDVRNYRGYVVEYVRADTVQELTAERDRLRDDLEELDFLRHEGGPDSVAAIEAERDRLRHAIMFWLEAEEPDVDAAINMMRAALKRETP